MVINDDEIEASRIQGQARSFREKENIKDFFGRKALQAKRARDARAYGELLRRLKILEDSEEWKNAWKYCYSE